MALFVDVVNITVKAGDGGNGCVSFHREKFVQAGGPDGGDGGRGGDVIFVATERMHTLMDFRYTRKFTAGNGEDGSANRKTGKSGADAVIQVPPGTVVRERATGRLLLDLYEPGVAKTLVHGGKGGFGNQHFATPTRQAPQFAKPGEKREIIELTLELKSTVGAGDSMVAGLACGFIGDNELEEAFRMGVACASARCTTEGYRVIDKNLYREFLSRVEIERL